jgi:uncharacterized protein
MQGTAVTFEKLKVLLKDFCLKHPIQKLEVFGSVAQGTATQESDVDLLVTFKPDAKLTFLEVADMAGEAEEIIGGEVDFVERESIEKTANKFKREAILNSAVCLYAT